MLKMFIRFTDRFFKVKKMKHILFILISFTVLNGLAASRIAAQKRKSPSKQLTVTKFELKDAETATGGKLYITVGGRKRKIDDQAFAAWIINGGKAIVFSGADGAGGFENEGQSLRIYDVATGKTKKILSEYVAVDAVMETIISTGETALLVRMSDGGLANPNAEICKE
jgi:hypothetical protein